MKTEKPEVEEKVDWNDDGKTGVMKHRRKVPVFSSDTGRVVGYTETNTVAEVNRNDLEYNQLQWKTMLDKLEEEVQNLQSKLNNIGKKPNKTSEMVRLEKNLQALHKINEYDKIVKQLEEKRAERDKQKDMVDQREKSLALEEKSEGET